jgi:hypothetical protein
MYKTRLAPVGQAAGQHAAAAAPAGQHSYAASTGRLGSAGRSAAGPSARVRGMAAAGSPRASMRMAGAAGPDSPKQGRPAGQVLDPYSAELAFTPLVLTPGHAAGSSAAVSAGLRESGNGAHAQGRTGAAGSTHHDLSGPLGPPEMQVRSD